MQRITRILTTLILSLALALPAAAEVKLTGQTLLRACNLFINYTDGNLRTPSLSDWFDIGSCQGLMLGLTEMNGFYQLLFEKVHSEGKAFFCEPVGTDNLQSVRIVVKYAKDHPELLHMPGVLLAIYAFQEAFPCPAPRQPVR